ncbi:hypothetical protein [Cupriavidus sp. TMH.W2]|uniref:hypothetical protein n=1 Tax=Cupriavidus sp. TMH.W2 TaxID=3434465 RepID=UPI003D76F0A7
MSTPNPIASTDATAMPRAPAARLRRALDVLLAVLNLLAVVGLSLLASRVRFETVLALAAGLLVLNGGSLLYRWWRPYAKAAQSPQLLRRVMAVAAVLMLYEGLAGLGVVVAQARARDAVAAYQQQRRQDLAATMDCERKPDSCWQEAARGAGTAFGLGLMVTMGPKDAFDPVTRREILLRAIGMMQAESTGDAMRGLRAVDRACARSILCSVSLGRSAARDAVSLQQTVGMIDMLAQRTRERGDR